MTLKKRVRIIFGCNEESGWKGIKYYLRKEEKPCCGFTPDGLFPIVNREKGILQVQLVKDFKDDDTRNPIKFISLKGGVRPNMVPDYCECKMSTGVQTYELVKNIIDKYGYKDDMDVEFNNDICIIKSRGISVASSIPENGKNAITRLLGMIEEIPFTQSSIREFIRFIKDNIGEQLNGKTLGIQMEDDVSGHLTLNLGLADIDEKRGCITLDIRYPVKRREEEIISQLNKKVEMTKIVVRRCDGKAPLYVPEDHFMIKILSRAYEEVTGMKAELLSIGGGTYARALDNMVAFGGLFPGRQILAHQKDEFLYIEDLIKMTKIYTNSIKTLVE
ncbi:putative dipeptidase [subsurface metagenome]